MLQFAATMRNRHRRPISETVADILRESGAGYNEIERRSGGRLSHSFLSKLISGASANPRLDKLIQLSDVFEVPIARLVDDGTDEPIDFAQSLFFEAFDLYQRLEKSNHRSMAENYIRDLIQILRGAPKKAETEPDSERLRKGEAH